MKKRNDGKKRFENREAVLEFAEVMIAVKYLLEYFNITDSLDLSRGDFLHEANGRFLVAKGIPRLHTWECSCR